MFWDVLATVIKKENNKRMKETTAHASDNVYTKTRSQSEISSKKFEILDSLTSCSEVGLRTTQTA